MKEYWIFESQPKAEIHKFFEGSKKEAVRKYEIETGRKYKFVSERAAMGRDNITVVEKSDWLHYNFRRASQAVEVR